MLNHIGIRWVFFLFLQNQGTKYISYVLSARLKIDFFGLECKFEV